MSSLAFSPSFICTTPSSQPGRRCQQKLPIVILVAVGVGELTLDDTANANGRLEGAAAGGRVELLALLLGLARGAEPARVLHGDGVALLGRGAAALGDDGLGNTHVACGRVE